MAQNFGPGIQGGVVLIDPATGEPYRASGGGAAQTAALDATVAGAVTTPGSLTNAALSSTYATAAQGVKADSAVQPAALGDYDTTAVVNGKIAALSSTYALREGSLVTIIGSSIARGGDTELGIGGGGLTEAGHSWFSWACALSGQRILRGKNCGIIGNTTAMVLARITDVTAQSPKPDACILYCGSNDAVAAVTAADYATNVRAIIAALQAAKIVPILSTVVPSINSPEYVTCNTYNTILRGLAREKGLVLLDLHNLMVDSSTGAQLSLYSTGGDGVHPGSAGYKAIGQYVADTLAPLMAPTVVDMITDPLDPTNLVVNGLYQGTVTNGKAASWGQELKPAGTTFSVITDSSFAQGNVQRIDLAAAASRASIFQYVDPPKFAVGDRLEVTFRFRAAITTAGACYVRIGFTGATAPTYVHPLYIDTSGEGTARVVFTVPTGTTRLMFMQRVEAGTATFDVAQMTLRNLTALGIA